MFVIYFIKIFLFICQKTQEINKSKKDITKPIDDISSIYKWARKNGIYIHNNMQLNKNKINDLKHNFYYFISNSTIPNNTLLLKIPSNIMISQPALDNIFKTSKNKKYSNLWSKISSINNYITYSSAKQLFYISIILSDSSFRQKGKFYKNYKEYLNMYNYINLDHFPIYYTMKEMVYLNSSHFGKEIKNNFESINNEYYLIKNVLNFDDSVIVDDYIKYRILSLSNSMNINNQTYIIPLIDCFQKKVNKTNGQYNAYIKLIQNKNNKNNNSQYKQYDIEIYSNKTIKKNDEIYLLWKQISNVECLLYYGFIDENNLITSEYLVELVNKHFIQDLNVDKINNKYAINFEKIIQPKFYDLNNEFYYDFLYYAYSNLSQYFDQYYHNNEGPYQMMKDNLEYYLKLYEEMYNNDLININVEGINKKRYVKNILGVEKKLIENRIHLLNNKINYIRNNKKEKDILELLRRNAKYRKNGFNNF